MAVPGVIQADLHEGIGRSLDRVLVAVVENWVLVTRSERDPGGPAKRREAGVRRPVVESLPTRSGEISVSVCLPRGHSSSADAESARRVALPSVSQPLQRAGRTHLHTGGECQRRDDLHRLPSLRERERELREGERRAENADHASTTPAATLSTTLDHRFAPRCILDEIPLFRSRSTTSSARVMAPVTAPSMRGRRTQRRWQRAGTGRAVGAAMCVEVCAAQGAVLPGPVEPGLMCTGASSSFKSSPRGGRYMWRDASAARVESPRRQPLTGGPALFLRLPAEGLDPSARGRRARSTTS